MVDFEAIRKIPHPSPALVCVGYNYHFMPAINELRRELVDVTFNTSWLGEEIVADHGNIVRHCRELFSRCCRRRRIQSKSRIIEVRELATTLCLSFVEIWHGELSVK